MNVGDTLFAFAPTVVCTNAVVAICVEFVSAGAVGAFGVPVNVGDILFAFVSIAASIRSALALNTLTS